jgi:hypothetical protein
VTLELARKMFMGIGGTKSGRQRKSDYWDGSLDHVRSCRLGNTVALSGCVDLEEEEEGSQGGGREEVSGSELRLQRASVPRVEPAVCVRYEWKGFERCFSKYL